MNERDFVQKKRQDWERLESLVAKAGGRRGARALSREELKAFGPLYRRASSDLAYARAHAVSADLVAHLNGLVGRAYALLYESERSGKPLRSLAHFYSVEFPALFQKRIGYFLAAIAVTLAGAAFAYWLVITQPEKTSLLIPEAFRQSLEAWKSGSVSDAASPEFAGMLMVNNQNVGLTAFATGFFAGVPTFAILLSNGLTLGAFAAVMTQAGRHGTFWPGIVPHGIAELTAIFICGGAGFLLGKGLLVPGPYRRLDALRLSGMEAAKLALGTIPMFVFAGVIEAMFSRLAIPAGLRYGFAALNGILWYAYLLLPRVPAENRSGTELAGDEKRRHKRLSTA